MRKILFLALQAHCKRLQPARHGPAQAQLEAVLMLDEASCIGTSFLQGAGQAHARANDCPRSFAATWQQDVPATAQDRSAGFRAALPDESGGMPAYQYIASGSPEHAVLPDVFVRAQFPRDAITRSAPGRRALMRR